MMFLNHFLLAFLSLKSVIAASCPLSPSYEAPVLASGWTATLVAQGLSKPRSIVRDARGNLLVVEQGNGVVHLQVGDGDGDCPQSLMATYLVNDTSLNHGLVLAQGSPPALFASSSDTVYAYDYDASAPSLANRRTVLSGMSNGGHTTRTLLLSQKVSDVLIISRGSDGNLDDEALDLSSGHSQLKAFDISRFNGSSSSSSSTPTVEPLDFESDGILLGWGLRNSVGIAEHPNTGGVFTVENSADDIERLGRDVHTDNPGEELNYHGILARSGGANESSTLRVRDTAASGNNYGYPTCFAAWDASKLPQNDNLTTGVQFSLGGDDDVDDRVCAEQRTAPRLTFQAHMAPLDIKFAKDGQTAYISFHGSWNRSPGVGYKVSSIVFNSTTGQPASESDSRDAAIDIMTNGDLDDCPGDCFRPAGLWIDEDESGAEAEDSSNDRTTSRLWMTSDSTGEVWLLRRNGTVNGGGDGDGNLGGGSAARNDRDSGAMGSRSPDVATTLALATVTIGLALVLS